MALSVVPCTKSSTVQFPGRVHARVVGSVPSRKHAGGKKSMFLSHCCFSPSPFLSLKSIEIYFLKTATTKKHTTRGPQAKSQRLPKPKNTDSALASLAQFVVMLSCAPKDSRFDSWSGHPRQATDQCFYLTSMFLSF